MATPDATSENTHTGASPAISAGKKSATLTARDWVNTVSYTIAGITAIGLLLVVIGALLTPSDLFILIGVGIVCLGSVGWIMLAILAIAGTIKRLFTSSERAGTGRYQPGQSSRNR